MANKTQKLILEMLAENRELSEKEIDEGLVARGRSISYDAIMINLGKMTRAGQLTVRRFAENYLYCDERKHWTNHYRIKKDR